MSPKASNDDLAGIFLKLSGSGYENCLSKLKQAGAVDRYGDINANGLQSVAGDLHVSTSALAGELSKRTGISFENALTHLNSGSDLASRCTYRHAWGADSSD